MPTGLDLEKSSVWLGLTQADSLIQEVCFAECREQTNSTQYIPTAQQPKAGKMSDPSQSQDFNITRLFAVACDSMTENASLRLQCGMIEPFHLPCFEDLLHQLQLIGSVSAVGLIGIEA